MNYIIFGVVIVYRSVFARNYTLTLKVYENNHECRVLFTQKIQDTYIKISYNFKQRYFKKTDISFVLSKKSSYSRC